MKLPFSAPSISGHKSKTHLTIIAALLSMIGPFTIDAYLPSFPDIEKTFGISRAILSQSLAVYLVAFAVSTLFWGPLADRLGRRLIIRTSLLIYMVASVGCGLAETSDAFMLLRVLQGFAASGGLIASRAMIRDAHDAESAHRAMSQVMLLFALAPAIAPILGGWLHDHFGWRSVFWFLTAFAVLLFIMSLLIQETLQKEHRRSFHPRAVMKVYIATLKHRQFPLLVLTMGFTFSGLFLYIAGAPTIIYDFLGLNSNEFGFLFIPMVCGMMLGSFISGRLAHRWPVMRINKTGFTFIIIAVVLNLFQSFVFPPNVVSIVGPMILYVFGVAMIMPVITIMALDCFPHNRGAAASMQGFFQMFINACIASIAVPLLQTKSQHFVLGQLVFVTVALILWYFAIRAKKQAV